MKEAKDIFFVADKTEGQEHSFIDGMLRDVAPNYCDNVYIIYAGAGNKPSKYIEGSPNVIISPFQRKGISRILHAVYCVKMFASSVDKSKGTTRVLVRNEILSLAAFIFYRGASSSDFEIFFQNSFPHEKTYKIKLLRPLVRFLLKVLLGRCDGILVVDQGAIPRIRNYSKNSEIRVVPLCTDFTPLPHVEKKSTTISFVYVGTLSEVRQPWIMIKSFAELGDLDFRLIIAGVDMEELRKNCSADEDIDRLVSLKKLEVLGKVHRSKVREIISSADVGLNLIPPIEIFLESSSTKLGEYLSQGIPVISSNGIPYHERMHGEFNIGWLVDFASPAISKCIKEIILAGRVGMEKFQQPCLQAHSEKLSYKSYIDEIIR